ncbi:hypothetical protein NDU88_002470 [Pleurodeles waltl]|uniref:Uncharacterized protein n=1 Tax=Pleurodeles waltl TaxID=8319 RepID=A0AAV7TLX4_PLEWA|nr:hypothetical protein NDU88_002470 [Pleurodeles waltl]
MAEQRQSKKEGNLKELFAKTPAKKQEQTPGAAPEGKGPGCGEQPKVSLLAVLEKQSTFGGVAGFKANLSNCSILNLTVSETEVEAFRPALSGPPDLHYPSRYNPA